MRISPRQLTVGLLAMATLVAAAEADAVRLKRGLEYSSVKIVAVRNGFVTYKFGGRNVSKALASVKTITLSDNADFNRGEALLVDSKFTEALAAYRLAEGSADKAWQRWLVSYRLLAAADGAGDVEEAVKRWVTIVEADGMSEASLKLHPTRRAPPKSEANDKAIALLEAKAASVKNKPYLREIKTLLVELYTVQGQAEKAAKATAELSSATAKPPATGGKDPGAAPVVPAGSGRNADALRLAGVSPKDGNYDAVIQQIQPKLKAFSQVELAGALYMMGAAQLQLGKAQKDAARRKDLLTQSGLNLMRVVVFLGDAPQAPAALLDAGEVNHLLGNADGARSAYGMLAKRHPRSTQAAEAKKRVAAMDKANGG